MFGHAIFNRMGRQVMRPAEGMFRLELYEIDREESLLHKQQVG